MLTVTYICMSELKHELARCFRFRVSFVSCQFTFIYVALNPNNSYVVVRPDDNAENFYACVSCVLQQVTYAMVLQTCARDTGHCAQEQKSSTRIEIKINT